MSIEIPIDIEVETGGGSTGGSSPVSIVTLQLSSGNVGSSYFEYLDAIDGYTPYIWNLTSGTLPTGLLLDPTGIISGTPTTSGSFTFTLRVSDQINGRDNRSFTIQIAASSNPIITTTSLPSILVNQLYNRTLTATDGVTPYTNWILTDGILPNGITLNATTGVINGTPTIPGTYAFTVQVTDSNSLTDIQALSIVVQAISPTITTNSLSDGVAGVSYSGVINATGGSPPYVAWDITVGQLPPGLNITGYPANATITGIPTAVGNYTFTVRVTDSLSGSITKVLNIVIYDGNFPVISTINLPNGQIGSSYSNGLIAAGGSLPYKWSLFSDVLPPGLTLNENTGLITGAPTANGSYVFTVKVIDNNGNIDTQILSIVIGQYTLPAIITDNLPNVIVGSFYYSYVQAVGGDLPYSWTLLSPLPIGLTINESTGLITGIPTVSGITNFNIQVEDGEGEIDIKSFSIVVGETNLPLIINTSIPAGDRLISYNQTLTAAGGTPSYTWTLTSGGLPDGLSLSSNGILSGIPTTIGLYNFTVTLKDYLNQSDTQNYSLIIKSTGYDSRCCLCVFTGEVVEFSHNAINGVLTSTGGTILSDKKWQAPSLEGFYDVTISVEGINGIISVKNTVHVIKKLEVVGNGSITDLLPGQTFRINTNYPREMVTWTTSCESLVLFKNGNIVINTHPGDRCFGALDCTLRGTLKPIDNCDITSFVDVKIKINPIYPTPNNCGPEINKWLRESADFRVIITEFEGGCDETHIRNTVPIVKWNITYTGLSNFVDGDSICPNCKEACNSNGTPTKSCLCDDQTNISSYTTNNPSNPNGEAGYNYSVDCPSALRTSNRLDDFWNLVYGQYKTFTLIDYDTKEIWYNVRFSDKMDVDHTNRRTATNRNIKLVWKPCCNKSPKGGTCSRHGVTNYRITNINVDPNYDNQNCYTIIDVLSDVYDQTSLVVECEEVDVCEEVAENGLTDIVENGIDVVEC